MYGEKANRAFWGKYLRYEVVLFLAVAAICWLINQRTLAGYANGLIVAGLLVMAVVVFAIIGQWGTTRSFGYLYGATVSEKPIQQQTSEDLKRGMFSTHELVQEIAIGLLPFATGILLQFVA